MQALLFCWRLQQQNINAQSEAIPTWPCFHIAHKHRKQFKIHLTMNSTGCRIITCLKSDSRAIAWFIATRLRLHSVNRQRQSSRNNFIQSHCVYFTSLDFYLWGGMRAQRGCKHILWVARFLQWFFLQSAASAWALWIQLCAAWFFRDVRCVSDASNLCNLICTKLQCAQRYCIIIHLVEQQIPWGIISGSCRAHFEIILGVILGSFLGHLGIILGSS